MENTGFDFKKIFYAGIGAAALTAEKARDLVRELIEKGEMTVEQGELINEELKRNIGSKMRSAAEALDPEYKPSVIEMMDSMSTEELNLIRAKLIQLEPGE